MNTHYYNASTARSDDAMWAQKRSLNASPRGRPTLPIKKRPVISSSHPSCGVDNSADILCKNAPKSLGTLSPHGRPCLPLKKRPVSSFHPSCGMDNSKKAIPSKSLDGLYPREWTSLPLKKRPIRSMHPSCGMDNGAANLLRKKAPKTLVAQDGALKKNDIPPVTPDTDMIVRNVHKDDESVPQGLQQQFALLT
jgi:hypothetical protein